MLGFYHEFVKRIYKKVNKRTQGMANLKTFLLPMLAKLPTKWCTQGKMDRQKWKARWTLEKSFSNKYVPFVLIALH